MCLKANAQNSLELFAMTCGNMTKDCAWYGLEFDIQCMHALKTSRQQRLGSEDVDTTHQRNRILIRFLHLVLSCGVPLEVSPKILKHYDKSYGIDQHERVSAGNVVRSHNLALFEIRRSVCAVLLLSRNLKTSNGTLHHRRASNRKDHNWKFGELGKSTCSKCETSDCILYLSSFEDAKFNILFRFFVQRN